MIHTLFVKDEFCPQIEAVKKSALDAGFGTWKPAKGKVGSSVYEGMNWKGSHAPMVAALVSSYGGLPVLPNSMFFRVSKPTTEKAYVHSDRHDGNWTCVAYLSEHKETYGTAFYRHKKTGLYEMPTFEEMEGNKDFDELKHDMVHGGKGEWEQTDFVRGRFNRAVIFHAPLFHSRFPLHGIGKKDADARMIWGCHFFI